VLEIRGAVVDPGAPLDTAAASARAAGGAARLSPPIDVE
jgi:hypothetical protein